MAAAMAVSGPRHGALALAVLCIFAVLAAPASGVGAESEPSAALRSLTGGPSVDARRVLVLYDDVRLKETHSIFFKQIADRGFELTFQSASAPSLTLQKYGEYLYDHILIFANTITDFGGAVSVPALLDFVAAGNNLMLATGPKVSAPLRELANQLGMDFAPDGNVAMDHWTVDQQDAGTHTLFAANDLTAEFALLPAAGALSAPVLYSGTAFVTGASEFAFAVLRGNPTTIVHTSTRSDAAPFAVGRTAGLVGALQSRVNSRVIIAGSIDMFSDRLMTSAVSMTAVQDGSKATFAKSGNEEFAKAITQWLFQRSHVLRIAASSHHRVGEGARPAHYRIKDTIHFWVVIEEYKNGKWIPFQAPDVQFEARMLDPYIRVNLEPSSSGNFSVTRMLPDVYGVYTFRASYYKRGYTFLDLPDVLPVRPFRHTDYERFIPAAYPYYAAAFVLMAAVSLLLIAVMYHSDTAAAKKKTA